MYEEEAKITVVEASPAMHEEEGIALLDLKAKKVNKSESSASGNKPKKVNKSESSARGNKAKKVNKSETSASGNKAKKVNKSESSASGNAVLGEIICDNVLNSEEIISSIHQAWKNRSYGYVLITNIEHNKYLFKCDSAKIALRITQDGPWTILGHFLCLEHWEADKSLKEIPLGNVRIWVRVHGLSYGDLVAQGRDIPREIGDHIGVFITKDKWNTMHNRKHGFIRIKVRMNCYATIKTGMWINGESGKYRVDFKYENVAELCYHCGRFGHSTGSCRPMNIRHPDFGPWLRAEPFDFNENKYRRDDCIEKIMFVIFLAVLIAVIYYAMKLLGYLIGFLIPKPKFDH